MFKRIRHTLFCPEYYNIAGSLKNIKFVVKPETTPEFKFNTSLDFNSITVYKTVSVLYTETYCPTCNILLNTEARNNTVQVIISLDLDKQFDLFNYLLLVESTFTTSEISNICLELFDTEKMAFRADWKNCLKKIMKISDSQIELILESNKEYTKSVINCIERMSE